MRHSGKAGPLATGTWRLTASPSMRPKFRPRHSKRSMTMSSAGKVVASLPII